MADDVPESVPAPSLDSVVDNLATAIVVVSIERRLLALNPAAEAMLDVSANQVDGIALGALVPGSPAFDDALGRVIASDQPLVERELELGLAGGKIAVDCMLTPVSDERGRRFVIVELVSRDRPRQMSRDESLLHQNETARALVRGLAHEIKNPLGGLRGAAQLLERELPDEALAEYTRVIIHEADRLQNLVDRMLGPRTPPRMRELNIHEILERVRALIEAQSAAGVAVERDYDPSIPPVRADEEMLIQAMLNIAHNAALAVGARGRITLRTRVQRQVAIGHRYHRLVCRIDVHDDGPGVPPEIIDQVFYPMVSGREGGVGLGLSIAQSLVYQHGGIVECTSQPRDTTFSIVLPIANDHSEWPASAESVPA